MLNIARILATKGGHVFTIGPDEPVREALRLLAHHQVGALLVVDSARRPIGILSERDLVRAAARSEQLFAVPVRDLMTTHVIVGHPADDLAAVSHTMTEKRIRHLPVMDGERLVGIVSIGDVVKAQRDQYAGEVDTLQTQMLADAPEPGR
jgi:CBS domain-containing protein